MKKALLAVFPVLAAAALWLWLAENGAGRTEPVLALARLAGITGALGVMGQLLAMTRAPWLEPLTGGALPVKWHHRAGLLIPLALLAHPPLAAWHHARLSGVSFAEQYLSVLGWDYVLLAAAGEALIIAAALLSLDFIRKRLPYGVWHKLHLGVYAGLALSLGHQFALGGDLSSEKPWFFWAWCGLLVFSGASALWYRALKPRLGVKV